MNSGIKLRFDSNLTEIAEFDRMFVYIWEDSDDNAECKFGERWVPAGLNPVSECQKRVYNSLGVRKDRVKDGKITLVAIFDVTDMAKTVGRYYKQSRMDDLLRADIGYRKGSTGEVHVLSGQEMKGRVAELLAGHGQALVEVTLSTKQYEVAGEVLNHFENGANIILANLCARYGKTIWSAAVALESNAQLIIVASYVKTVFTSFANDLKMFDQFADCVHVDMANPEYQSKIRKALSGKKRVFAYLSLCNGSKREARINFLFKTRAPFLIIDEADFGAHKSKQAMPLVRKMSKDSKAKAIIMTGTNADRAVTHWPIDTMVSVTYPELLMQKRATKADPENNGEGPRLLKHFRLDNHRDVLVPDFECYQMDLSGPVEKAIDAGEVDEDFKTLPSWTKFGKYPNKSKGFFVRVLESVFLGKGGHDELNVDFQTENFSGRPRVAMMFMSARNASMDMIDGIANETLGAWNIITLTGTRKHNGQKISQRNCQQIVSEIVETAKKSGKSVLIITNIMAQRSFSIPEISELYLAYDCGEVGATIQKMSRTLTPGDIDKVGKIFSLSFDPNRDDKFDDLVIETAINYKERKNLPSLADALREVLATIDIFTCKKNGAIKMNKDTYLEAALARKGVSRVLGRVTNLHQCRPDIIEALAQGNSEYITAQRVKATQRGKACDTKKRAKGVLRTDSESKALAKARQVVVTIYENLGLLLEYSDTKRVLDAFNAIENDELARRGIEEDFGVSYDVLGYLLENDIIKQSHVELMYDV